MPAVLNMENLREIIDNDRELERELVSNFYTCYHTCMSELETSLDTQDTVLWRNAAHALKGIAYNIGAECLGELSLKAERACESSILEKQELFEALKQSYAAVDYALKRATT